MRGSRAAATVALMRTLTPAKASSMNPFKCKRAEHTQHYSVYIYFQEPSRPRPPSQFPSSLRFSHLLSCFSVFFPSRSLPFHHPLLLPPLVLWSSSSGPPRLPFCSPSTPQPRYPFSSPAWSGQPPISPPSVGRTLNISGGGN